MFSHHLLHCETFVCGFMVCTLCMYVWAYLLVCVCVRVCVCGTYVRLHVRNYTYGIVSVKRDLAWFFKISNFWIFKSLKCPLHIANSYTLRIGVSVMESEGSEFLINASITFLLRVLEILYMHCVFLCRHDPICICVFVHAHNDGQKLLHHESSRNSMQ